MILNFFPNNGVKKTAGDSTEGYENFKREWDVDVYRLSD